MEMELFDRALIYAAEHHSGQRRKRSDAPYILHPMEVATIAATMTEDQNLLAAAVLHDTVEDAGATLSEIEALFGRRVALLVMTETEEKRAERPAEETWKLRKTETLNILRNTKDIDVKRLWLSDKLANMRSFHRLYLAQGSALWQSFHQKDPSEQAWYYRTIADCLPELADTAAYREYVALTEEVFAGVETAENTFE